MQSAHSVVKKTTFDKSLIKDYVVLDYESRRKRRIVLTSNNGKTFLLNLEKSGLLNDGDALKLDDNELILVKSAHETLLAIHADNQLLFTKMAWHLGNRHTPVEITVDTLYIQEDHVLSEMARGLGGHVTFVSRPFEPESGAYHTEHKH